MQKNRLVLGISAICLAAAGCGNNGGSAGGGTNFNAAFQKTESHVREFAEQAVEAEKKNDYSTAFRHYRALSLNPDLNQDQRNLANESMLQMSAKLRESADKGDKEAKQMLEDYRATK